MIDQKSQNQSEFPGSYLSLNDPQEKLWGGPKEAKTHPTAALEKPVDLLDDKVSQMLAILSDQDFNKNSEIQRLRLSLLLWVIHEKLDDTIKRAFDILISSIVLLLTSPIMLITAFAIKLDSRGPVIFRQERVGKWGEKFYCLKFRSMFEDAEERKSELMTLNEADQIVFKIKDDPRVTRVGRIIRKLSIDELPQILNVLKGDMSLVGPRPPLPTEVVNYEYDHMRRLDAVPGITGLQQVSGRSNLEFKRWVELDVEYIRKQSLWNDIKILLKTIPVVILGKGAY